VDLPVISIGNITVGGTGKTPIVIETVRRLRELGRRPAILTRGYAASAGETPDEVLEFARALPGVPVVVNPDRVAGAETARLEQNADCLVLDDGFQHRRLRRDLDVVLIDALDPWGGGWILPAGRLREPLQSLRRAQMFVISRANQVEAAELEQIEHTLSEWAPDTAVLHATVEPEAVVFPDERVEATGALGYHNVLPICGIGNPATFLTSVAQLAGRVCGELVFRDHQRYGPRHVRKIVDLAERRGADLVVTTRKDWVKLAPLWPQPAAGNAPQLARLEVRLELQDADGVFDDHLRRALEKHT
jgi:tetraacyldisaccharide 4'-kinase